MIKYSVIIAVYNRLHEVKELLASAEDLEFDRGGFEVIFVDDGSEDGFREFMKAYESPSGLQIRTLHQNNQGPGAARNYGMGEARGEYFLFLDSDCMVPKQWLLVIDQDLERRKLDAFGGPDTYHPSFTPLLKAINYSMTSFLGTGGTRGSRKSIAKYYPRSFNMGINRKVYETIGGMNQLRHGQDMDFSARIYQAGFKVGLIDNAFVYHKRRTSLGKFFKQIFNWGVARINLGRIHPDLLKPIHFLPALIVIGLFLLLISSLFFGFNLILKFACGLFVFVCCLAFFESYFIYGNFWTAVLSIVTLNIQVFAYGFGLIWAIFQWMTGKRPTGFVKNYYGKK